MMYAPRAWCPRVIHTYKGLSRIISAPLRWTLLRFLTTRAHHAASLSVMAMMCFIEGTGTKPSPYYSD
jgi:hypothetical protein